MLNPRIIPVLLMHERGLVKTKKFNEGKYVGDPLNAVKIFNEQEADELTFFDIDATVRQREPDYNLIEKIAMECRMPLCYGGGIKTVDQAERILKLGVEKISISSGAFENPQMVSELAKKVGSQSVVVCIDVKTGMFQSKLKCYTHNSKIKQDIDPLEFALAAQDMGAGELIINSIEKDGMMNGYDLNMISSFTKILSIPVTVVGGAGSHEDIQKLFSAEKLIGAGAGSLFVFKGIYKAVLINYPTENEKAIIFGKKH